MFKIIEPVPNSKFVGNADKMYIKLYTNPRLTVHFCSILVKKLKLKEGDKLNFMHDEGTKQIAFTSNTNKGFELKKTTQSPLAVFSSQLANLIRENYELDPTKSYKIEVTYANLNPNVKTWVLNKPVIL